MITVKAFWRNNALPAQKIKIAVAFNDFFGGGVTDDNGEIDFDLEPGHGQIFYRGCPIYIGKIDEIITIHI
ncbi:hypothetical protein Sta7437_0731 [Stanieria cyanosphaera PCC 7437]|uniref:Uncharacterized protein n=1 Tax=Stanieria cyanosphaera (strain ATCC 29371 / PCC 7437) TaxID=111780 RepID=K9XNY3_STAC7|nr:hypothetical protein [Stanieria cyanosphaera]AFZ34325.1 hypothetical protein Sta7437_0731 [Stanieria cyanosphaera PCC 7437]